MEPDQASPRVGNLLMETWLKNVTSGARRSAFTLAVGGIAGTCADFSGFLVNTAAPPTAAR
jgi:hypothetical protein